MRQHGDGFGFLRTAVPAGQGFFTGGNAGRGKGNGAVGIVVCCCFGNGFGFGCRAEFAGVGSDTFRLTGCSLCYCNDAVGMVGKLVDGFCFLCTAQNTGIGDHTARGAGSRGGDSACVRMRGAFGDGFKLPFLVLGNGIGLHCHRAA